MESLEQKRASLAWQRVNAVVQAGRLENYRSLVREFPTMVQSMGLGQSVAFLMAKGKDEHSDLLEHMTEWVLEKSPVPWKSVQSQPQNRAQKLMVYLLEHEPPVWWAAEREAIEFAIWLKRFAEALYESQKAAPAQGQAEVQT
jgi:CRISPR-associated protein Cmr5